MLTDQQKTKVFKTCIQDIRSGEDRETYDFDLIDSLKSNRDKILSMFATENISRIDERDGLQAEIHLLFDIVKDVYIKTAVEPAEEVAMLHSQRTQTLLMNLKSEIQLDHINFDKIIHSPRYKEWGGAGVIVTSDPNREHADHHLFVVTEFAPIITWVFERFRDICHPDYVKVARMTERYLSETEKSSVTMKDIALRMVDEVIKGIPPVYQRFTDEEDFEEFDDYEEQNSSN